ncbi:response regulator [Roseinatronobacter alkalisoli]|uniref:Response regulator n=1 Tax=Roseinatronobacter alkalisoli TaxID=3028235 RepID=A0ABT5TDM7_9RHOB|nr:response regulator [Roseinatronobacter sp. HJB301]MDD7973230.1 response regulator [Roseinatronobacter sp. HJB301]
MLDPPLILCCEDEPQLLRDISDELQAAGYRVQEARNGAELLASLQHCNPDLLLCDIMMPELDGYGVLARLRRDYSHLAHVPLVFLSALSMTDAIIRGKRAGADDYLTKPINYDLLLSTIEARLRQSTQARANITHVAGLGQHLLENLTIGVLIFTADGTLIRANAIADQILLEKGSEISDTLAKSIHALGAQARAGREDVRSLLLDETTSCIAQLHACPPAPVTGAPAMVMAFLTRQDALVPLSSVALSAMFDLTPTEARVARHLASGLRPDEIALELDVAGTTIAFHLRNVFAKTGTHRQADLVALLLSLPVRHPA